MSTTSNSKLLRRTAVALAAVAGFAVLLPAFAQSGILRKSTGESICNYTDMRVTPSGGITVTCEGTTTPPPTPPPAGESFSITSSPASLAATASGLVLVTRVNGTNSVAAINYTISGGCSPANGTFWIGTERATEGFLVTAPGGGGGSCTATLNSVNVGALATPSSATISITGGTTPVQPGCAAPPNDVLDFELKLSGADILRMGSGRIAAAVLPKVSDTRGSSSGKIIFGEATIAPRAAAVEISVTRCRGVIDTNGGHCYMRSTNVAFMKMEWIEQPIWGASTDNIANIYGLCKAFQADGPFYVNVRYSYSPSDCQWGDCGLVNQWNYATF